MISGLGFLVLCLDLVSLGWLLTRRVSLDCGQGSLIVDGTSEGGGWESAAVR